MAAIPWIYINPQFIYGSHGSGWRKKLPESNGLPSAADVIAALDPAVFEHKKLRLVLEDDLMLPLQVELDKKVSQRELAQYLLWKLKRHIPYPTEQIELRYLSLEQGERYLTFSLPKFWLEPLHQGLKDRGVQLGYVNGAFLTLLDQYAACNDKLLLCVYRDFYLMTQLDKKGRMLWFRSRRLPYNDADQLDMQTWLHADLEPVVRGEAQGHEVIVFNFAEAHQAQGAALQRALAGLGATVSLKPEQASAPLDLLRSLVGG